MVSWFKMEEAGREWPSSVGSYSGQEIQGPLEVVRHWRRGAPRPVTYLRGSNATKFIFGHVIHDTFSICSASRYEAGQHGRVLQGSRTNWLHGHHAGRAGVAFYERWMTPQRAHGVPPGVKSTSLDWIVMCATNAARRAYANSTSVAVDGPAPDSGHQSLGVNVGATMRGELTAAGDVPSDWAVAEVITWNRELSDREMLDVSAYLQRKLEGRGDEGKAVGPKPAPEASGQSGNELADIRKQDKRLKDRGRREKAKIKGQGFFLRKQVLFERARDREGCSTSSPQDCDNETSRELDGYMALEPDVLEAAYLREKHTLDVVMAAELQRAKKDLAARARAARKNLSEAGRRISELPFAADGLAAWFRSEDAAAAWPSAVGTHVGRTIMGEVTARRMNGPQRRHMRALSGSRMASFRFGQVLAERFTLCSATRYSGSHRQRILVGEQHDLVHGHWRNYAGVAFYRGWATDPRPAEREGYDKWMVMCGTNAALRQYVNGVNHAVNATFRGGNQSLAINSGIMQGDERSDWEAAEIIAWDRALSDEEMLQASKYLLGKLQSGASQNETVLRRQLAEFREVDENVAKIMDVIAASELEVESKIDDKRRQVLRMRKAWLHLKRAQVLCSPWDLSLCSPDEGTTLQDALSARMEDLVSNIAAKFGSVRELRAHVEWQRQNALVNADSMARTKALLDEPFEKYSVGRHCPHKGMKKKFYLYTGIPKIPCQSLCLETPACVFATWFSSGFCQLSKTCSPDARASDPSAVTIKIPSRLSQNKSKQKVQAQMSNYKRLEENLGKHREVQMRLESDIAQAVHRLETQQDSLELLNLARWRRLATEPKQASARTLPQSKQPPAKSSPQPPAKAHPQPKKPLAKAHPQPKQQPAKTPPQPKKPPAKASPQPKQLLKASQQSPAKTSPRPPEVSVGGRPKEL
ncbi:unnamed protein product [Prorocentrum cordatum]|uniref:Uncharacterized protein n=1 Tax=Prorocentrum cordatum TaxID=2364126 RepID=A0ABN9XQF8_9DINO|nr:unnamed protein product [Polarella glacialis]